MSFFRTRTDKHGNRYLYLEKRWREGKRVRTRSTYLGRSGEVDRSVAGHATEMQDMPQGFGVQEAQKAAEPDAWSQDSFLEDTQAPAEAPAPSDPATDAAPAGGDKDGGHGAEGEAEGDGDAGGEGEGS